MLDPHSSLPLYVKVKQALLREIRQGHYAPHQPVPPEHVLVQRFGVSRITVRRAISDLVAEGVLYRKAGKGTFVAAGPIVEVLSELTGHLEELQRMGLAPQVEVLEFATRPPQPDAAAALDDPPLALFARRLIRVQGTPLLVLDISIPAHLGLQVDPDLLSRVPINRLLEEGGHFPAAAEQRIGARPAYANEASLLQVPAGAPVLEVVRTEWGAGGQPLLWSRAVYRADRYQCVIRLHRRRRSGP